MTPLRIVAALILAAIVGGAAQAGAEKLPYGMSIVVIRGCEYIKAQQYGGYVYTHLGNCTNHAPAVVTVTNECTRQHCTNACLQCGTWRPNQWLGDGMIATNDAGGVEK